jgi:hypothetical protein
MDTFQTTSFADQLSAGLVTWGTTVGITLGVMLLVCYVFTAIRLGPLSAGDRIYSVLVSAVGDLLFISPRRTFAIAWLAVKESIRKQAVAGLIIFLIVLAFALWFLDSETYDPSSLYISFVMNAVNYLVLLLAVLTAAFSLPNDMKNKTIYTIVTKPVRPSEIILGRILGFTAVCAIPLATMGLCSYLFVVRSLDHRHELTEADVRPIVAGPATRNVKPGSKQGSTSTAHSHRHKVTVDADGNGVTETNDSDRIEMDDAVDFHDRFGSSHWHVVTGEKRDGRMIYHVGPPQGQFHARVPIKGQLRFKEADGTASKEGYNVGNWTKRGYVAGGTLSAALFTFDGVDPNRFPDGVPLEMNIRLFRTTKEGMDKPIIGSLIIRNPINGLSSAPRNFAAREYVTLQQIIPRKLADSKGKQLDLFDDLAVNGRVEIELQCIPRSQFFGVGPDDLYLLAREGRFDVNFAKGLFGIWLQMVLTVVLAVVFSTFLSGPVAMLATAAAVIGALLRPFVVNVLRDNLFEGKAHTGGVLESMVRLTDQRAITLELEEGTTTSLIQSIDKVLNSLLDGMFTFIPDFSAMNDVNSVAGGFDISSSLLWMHTAQTLGFVLPLFLVGFIVFKLTEVAK